MDFFAWFPRWEPSNHTRELFTEPNWDSPWSLTLIGKVLNETHLPYRPLEHINRNIPEEGSMMLER